MRLPTILASGADQTILVCRVIAAWATLIVAIPALGHVYPWPVRFVALSSLSGWAMEMVARFVALLA